MADNRSKNSGCLFALLSIFSGKGEAETDTLPYRTRDDFLSSAEASFRHVLLSVVKEQAVICPKVRLGDIFFVGKGEDKMSYINRIASKHVDFLFCDAKSLKPLAGVELDDASHSRPDREERDEFVDRVFQAAGLPLVHIKAQRDYNPQAVAAQVLPLLSRPHVSPTAALASAPSQPTASSMTSASKNIPICPKCGVSMVLRTAKGGPHAGKNFYGCPNYPKCREVIAVE